MFMYSVCVREWVHHDAIGGNAFTWRDTKLKQHTVSKKACFNTQCHHDISMSDALFLEKRTILVTFIDLLKGF